MQVVLSQWPVPDVPRAAAAWVAVAGGQLADRAAQLARCRGIAVEAASPEEAAALVAAWRAVGIDAHAVADDRLPVFPKPVVARQLIVEPGGTLLAAISLTGPPQRLQVHDVVLVLPALLHTRQTKLEAPTKKSTSAMGLAVDLATTGGLRTLLSSRPTSGGGKATETEATEAMLELWLVAPPRRLAVYASRLDYRAVTDTSARGGDNWRQWLRQLAASLGPELPGRDRLDAMAAGQPLPPDSMVSDSNDLARTGRWLLLRGG